MTGRPHVGRAIEAYYARMRADRRDDVVLADWERDDAFIALAAARWADDLEGSALGRESNRERMRLRHEGFVVIARARQEIEALRYACDHAIDNWVTPPEPPEEWIESALDLSVRAINQLDHHKIKRISHLTSRSEYELRQLRIGLRTIREIRSALDIHGLKFRDDARSKELQVVPGISPLVGSRLRSAGLVYLGELTELTETELWRVRGIGRKSVNEIKDVLKSYGLEFADFAKETKS